MYTSQSLNDDAKERNGKEKQSLMLISSWQTDQVGGILCVNVCLVLYLPQVTGWDVA